MEKWKQIFYTIVTVLLMLNGAFTAKQKSKRTEIESELYKNVLPYIKLVEHDAEIARSEIMKKKIKRIHHNKAKLLKEVDQKVLPWIDELTRLALKDKQSKGFSYQLKHFPHHIHGPSALKLNQVEQIGQENNGIKKIISENHQHNSKFKDIETKANHDIYLKPLPNTEDKTLASHNILIKQEEAGRISELTPKLSEQQIQLEDEQSSPKKVGSTIKKPKSFEFNGKITEEQERDIASEVAKITNEIAEFQEEIQHMSNPQIYSIKTQKDSHDVLVHGSSELMNKETVGSTDPYKSKDAPQLEETPLKQKLRNDTTLDISSELDIIDMANNNAELTKITKGLFEPKASLFKNKQKGLSGKKLQKPKSKSKVMKKNSGSVKIIFAGNVGFDGIVQYKVEAGICTYNESFKKIKHFLDKADHVVVSLDSPFKPHNNTDEKDIPYDHPENSLSYAGIDTVVLANNHILDYGPEAATYTAKTLRHSNTLYSGFTFSLNPKAKQEPVIYATNGVTVGLLSYCMNKDGCSLVRNKTKAGPTIFHEKVVKEEVLALRESGIDIITIYLHWGEEDDLMPSFQVKEIIRNLSSVKIDAIVGNHPNIDSHYYFHGTLVVLSLGTFLTPLHIQIYKTYPAASKHSKLMEKLWGKQSERWEMPSVNSKLLQIEVNRDGLIPFKTRYLSIQMNLNANHCLQTERVKNEWWIPICTRRDKQCVRLSKCNELECGHGVSI